MRKWPTRLRKLLARATGPDARASAEQQERSRWLCKLREYITHAELPLAKVPGGTQQPESAWEGVGHGLRARTLRRRVKDWERAARYFQIAFGRAWPSNVGMMLDYIQTMRGSGAAFSSIQSRVFALALMERAGGVEKSAHLHTHPFLQSRLKELSVSLRVGVERPTKKAPQTTIA